MGRVCSLTLFPNFGFSLSRMMQEMEKCRRKRPKISSSDQSEEVVSNEWEFIHLSEQEEDLIFRMYRLVGERWDLIAGRIPGRTAVELERFWIMRHSEMFSEKRNKNNKEKPKTVLRRIFNGFR